MLIANIIRILVITAIFVILAYPFITGTEKTKKYFWAAKLRYDSPHNRKNFLFVLLAFLVFLVLAFIFQLFDGILVFINKLPIIGYLFSEILRKLNSQPTLNFILFTLRLVIINFIVLYGYFILKAFIKNVILDSAFGLKKKKEKKKKAKKSDKNENPNDPDNLDTDNDVTESEEEVEEDEDEKNRKRRRIPDFLHSNTSDTVVTNDKSDSDTDDTNKDQTKKEKKYFNPISSFILGLFFEGDEYEYARDWAVRVRIILKCFLVLVEIVYGLFLLLVLASVFFSLPTKIYGFLISVLRINNWYIYPVISILFLQEICNFFKTPSPSPLEQEKKKKLLQKKQEEEDLDERLRKLLNTLKKKFDAEHYLRYYPEAVQDEIPEYTPKNRTYKSALQYIAKHMKLSSGRVVQSYMQCLDASFNDDHVYFASSFYSELGEYLVSYTYIRLLSGSRMVFVVSDPDERDNLRTFIGERLMQLTGTAKGAGWRIYTADERLDQADILIASPGDFKDGDLTSQYSDFFEEVTNAVFIDADRMISLDSYLCPVMATCLKKATSNNIRFIFLTQDLYKGFAARSLPKFFCAEPVLSFSSAQENESVSYVLWNRESKSHRIYNKHGQKNTCLECIIAELACQHKIDGIRLITESALDHAEHKILANCGVEINKIYRDIADVNYMIYSDERSNLAASLYACTRFRGKKKSIVHIISKPYFLREYFISKAATENFVNRSSFIQPRVLEHVDQHKLLLLRVFCDVSSEIGLPISVFEKQMHEVINVCMESGYIISSAFCKKLLKNRKADDLRTGELAAYLIAGLCDSDIYHTDTEFEACAHRSVGNDAKEYYLIIDPEKNDGFTLHREKYIIFNRAKEIYDMLFSCNKRIELRLNNEVIGHLDTFPIRAHLEFIAGQSIVYRNSEYEIEHISDDGNTVYLRNENVKIRHCLNTIHLRRYHVDSLVPIDKHVGILYNTKLNLEEIKVSECFAKFTGETYGFYGLTCDKQTLDFYHKDGVDGNMHVQHPHIRDISDGRILKVELKARIECNDGMRLLLAAVFNEFVRTIFPKAYHFISIVPVLAEPLPFGKDNDPISEIERIKALYPYLETPSEEFVETDSHRITFLFINDCYEDVGAFQWFYDLSGRYMQEFLANIYSYLHWLQIRPEKDHYIYFGGSTLPECYDLDGCCELLDGYNLVLSDLGDTDIETAGDDLQYDKIERCSFCHKEMESGRYSFFDKARYICSDCLDTVETDERLQQILAEMKSYLETTYPEIAFGSSKAALDSIYSLAADQVLSEYYYRMDFSERTIYTERDEPADNIRVSLLRGIIELWQSDNQYIFSYSKAQLYYEELIYLHSKGLHTSAEWIYNALSPELRRLVDEIAEYTGCKVTCASNDPDNLTVESEVNTDNEVNVDGETPVENDNTVEELPVVSDDITEPVVDDEIKEEPEQPENPEVVEEPTRKTSFDFIRSKFVTDDYDTDLDDDDNLFGDDDFTGLYDPNSIPRFWKRYLRHQKLDTGTQEIPNDQDDLIEQDNDDDIDIPNTDDNSNDIDNNVSDDKKKKKKKRRSWFSKKQSPGEKVQPYEEDEATNPRIRVYNEILRNAYNYCEGPIDTCGLSYDEIYQILIYVLGDYPELFWVTRYIPPIVSSEFHLAFRCKDANDKLDIKQINSKRAALKKAAKKFTKGISKKTDPYDALTTIYRRLILNTDYDSVNLNTNVSNDWQKDDQLRSLYSALVEHKVVCAGYAVAMQYLLQSIGIVTGYVISELDSDNVCHAFNILKIGKYCYYLDSTWGDRSDTTTGDDYRDLVLYDYFCVPYSEFIRTPASQREMHLPRKELYPSLEQFNYTNHEYYRFRNAYLTSYNEDEIIRIMTDAAMEYDEKEMGEFTIGIRFPNQDAANLAFSMLMSKDTVSRLLLKARDSVTKKSAYKLFDRRFGIFPPSESGIVCIRFVNN